MTATGSLAGQAASPMDEAVEICRVLGLAISNVSMYGRQHSVTAGALETAFTVFKQKLYVYSELEFVMSESGVILNGTPVETERTTGQLLVNQLKKLGVHDFTMSSSLTREEFECFADILAAVPGSDASAGGFEAAVKQAGIRGIRVKNVSYARVDKDADLSKMNFDESRGGGGEGKSSGKGIGMGSASGSKVFDLDAELDLDLSAFGFEMPAAAAETVADETDPALEAEARNFLEKKNAMEGIRRRLAGKIRAASGSAEALDKLKTQLQAIGFGEEDWYDLLSEGTTVATGRDNPTLEALQRIKTEVEQLADRRGGAMSGVVDSIGAEIARITQNTKGEIATLAGKLDADRDTIAKVEQDARDRGVGLNLSREELLESLAEINQELGQSLTVVTSVTDILLNGKLGTLSGDQQDVLKMATEGVERINRLVGYLSRLSGMPEKLSPDMKVLNEAYGSNA